MSPADHEFHQRLAAHPFLSGMNSNQLDILAECATPAQWDSDEVVFRAGDPARGFFLVETGSVAVESAAGDIGRAITIDIVKPGEPLGWSWMYEPFVCEYGARALEPTSAIFFDAARLTQHRGADLTLGHELFKRMSQVMVRRLSAARAKILEAAQRERTVG
jgi:CRP-like cAMP-binding protein